MAERWGTLWYILVHWGTRSCGRSSIRAAGVPLARRGVRVVASQWYALRRHSRSERADPHLTRSPFS